MDAFGVESDCVYRTYLMSSLAGSMDKCLLPRQRMNVADGKVDLRCEHIRVWLRLNHDIRRSLRISRLCSGSNKKQADRSSGCYAG